MSKLTETNQTSTLGLVVDESSQRQDQTQDQPRRSDCDLVFFRLGHRRVWGQTGLRDRQVSSHPGEGTNSWLDWQMFTIVLHHSLLQAAVVDHTWDLVSSSATTKHNHIRGSAHKCTNSTFIQKEYKYMHFSTHHYHYWRLNRASTCYKNNFEFFPPQMFSYLNNIPQHVFHYQ